MRTISPNPGPYICAQQQEKPHFELNNNIRSGPPFGHLRFKFLCLDQSIVW